jgi:hypothetical protein
MSALGQKRTHALPQIISIRSTIIMDLKAVAEFQGAALDLARPKRFRDSHSGASQFAQAKKPCVGLWSLFLG